MQKTEFENIKRVMAQVVNELDMAQRKEVLDQYKGGLKCDIADKNSKKF